MSSCLVCFLSLSLADMNLPLRSSENLFPVQRSQRMVDKKTKIKYKPKFSDHQKQLPSLKGRYKNTREFQSRNDIIFLLNIKQGRTKHLKNLKIYLMKCVNSLNYKMVDHYH